MKLGALSKSVITLSVAWAMCSCGTQHKVIRGDEAVVISPEKIGSTEKKNDISDSRTKLVKEAHTWIGTPYRYGGHDKKGTDCSGMVMEIYREALGIVLPRTTADQLDFCKKIDKKKLQPGDVLFFSSKASGGKIAHVGMYIGDGRMIHASSSKGVIISAVEDNYYITHYLSSGMVDHPVITNSQKTQMPLAEISKESPPDKEGRKTDKKTSRRRGLRK